MQVASLDARLALESAAFEAGAKRAADAFKNASDQINRHLDGMRGGMANAERGAHGFASSVGGAMGNVAFQVQDAITQFQSGTSALTIFVQQGSQIAGAFGPVGAVVGAAGAAAAIAAASLFDFNTQAKETPDYLDMLSEGMSGVESQAKKLAEEIDNASLSTLNLMRVAAELRRQEIGKAAGDIAEALAAPISARALEEAARQAPAVDLNVPFSGAQRMAGQRTSPTALEGRRAAGDIGAQIEKAITAGDVERLNQIIDQNQLLTPETAETLKRAQRAAQDVAVADATQRAIEEEKRKRTTGTGTAAAPAAAASAARPARSLQDMAGGGDDGRERRAAVNDNLRFELNQLDSFFAEKDKKRQDDLSFELRQLDKTLAEKDRAAREEKALRDRAAREAEATRERERSALEREGERRAEVVRSIAVEVDEKRRLLAAQAEGAASYRAVADAIEAEEAVRRLGANATAAEIAQTRQLVQERQALEASYAESQALQKAKAEREELIRTGSMTAIGGAPKSAAPMSRQAVEAQLGIPNAEAVEGAALTQAERFSDAWAEPDPSLVSEFAARMEELFA